MWVVGSRAVCCCIRDQMLEFLLSDESRYLPANRDIKSAMHQKIASINLEQCYGTTCCTKCTYDLLSHLSDGSLIWASLTVIITVKNGNHAEAGKILGDFILHCEYGHKGQKFPEVQSRKGTETLSESSLGSLGFLREHMWISDRQMWWHVFSDKRTTKEAKCEETICAGNALSFDKYFP